MMISPAVFKSYKLQPHEGPDSDQSHDVVGVGLNNLLVLQCFQNLKCLCLEAGIAFCPIGVKIHSQHLFTHHVAYRVGRVKNPSPAFYNPYLN